MKRMLGWALLVACVATGCKDDKATSEGGAASATATAAATAAGTAAAGGACDEYVAFLKKCVAKNAAAFQATLDAQEKAMQGATGAMKEQLEEGCRTGLATLKQSGQCE